MVPIVELGRVEELSALGVNELAERAGSKVCKVCCCRPLIAVLVEEDPVEFDDTGGSLNGLGAVLPGERDMRVASKESRGTQNISQVPVSQHSSFELCYCRRRTRGSARVLFNEFAKRSPK